MTLQILKEAQKTSEVDTGEVRTLVAEILGRVRKEGEAAVRYYSERFDRWNPPSFRLTPEEIASLEARVPEGLKREILFSIDNVKKFARAQKETLTDLRVETAPGVWLGQRYIPIESVGVYVPGGRYTLIASGIMSVVPAKVAGVSRVVACTPTRNGALSPAVVFAIHSAGADAIYSIGGAQAIGAMAFGMGDSLRPVDMIAGPGNKFVAEAKKQVFGIVGIDLLAGPTEIGVIADDGADPRLIASDILAQAEHDPDTRQFLVTMSASFADRVLKEIREQLGSLPTAEIAGAAWARNGVVAVASTPEDAVAFSDDFAPEHLHIHARDLDWYLDHLRNYGSLFLGEECTVVFSDKGVGTNHILPTGRAGRYTGGLWVGKYMKNVTYQRLDPKGSLWIAPHAVKISQAEGMPGHERSARARLEKLDPSGKHD